MLMKLSVIIANCKYNFCISIHKNVNRFITIMFVTTNSRVTIQYKYDYVQNISKTNQQCLSILPRFDFISDRLYISLFKLVAFA